MAAGDAQQRFCLRHLRRYAFIAQEMRRVNRAASTVLLELWVAWGASMLILLWIKLAKFREPMVAFYWYFRLVSCASSHMLVHRLIWFMMVNIYCMCDSMSGYVACMLLIWSLICRPWRDLGGLLLTCVAMRPLLISMRTNTNWIQLSLWNLAYYIKLQYVSIRQWGATEQDIEWYVYHHRAFAWCLDHICIMLVHVWI